MTRHEQASGPAASRLIDQRIRELGGWRGEALARMRGLIRDADPDVVEEWKWMGTPVWSHDGIICTGEAYTQVVKLTFARGASVPDPAGLFNASLEGNTRRAIDIRQGDMVDADAFKTLVQAAVAQNGLGRGTVRVTSARSGSGKADAAPAASKARPSKPRTKPAATRATKARATKPRTKAAARPARAKPRTTAARSKAAAKPKRAKPTRRTRTKTRG